VISWRRQVAGTLVAAVVAAGTLGCHPEPPCSSETPSCSTPTTPTPVTSTPSLSATLTSGCFGWPGTEFSPSNRAVVSTILRAGDRAAEFSLRDTEGAAVTLSGLLATRPVLLVHGAFT
jgi:hypothetical protein